LQDRGTVHLSYCLTQCLTNFEFELCPILVAVVFTIRQMNRPPVLKKLLTFAVNCISIHSTVMQYKGVKC